MKTNYALAAFAESLLSSKANTWYMYGNNGHKITEAFIQTKKIQYPDNYTDAHITELRKHIGAIGYDCSSIIDLYTGHDKSANGWLSAASESGSIDSMPEIVGLSVHFNGHVGVYVGGGYVVEARGTWYGIVKTRLQDRPWKNWAKVPYVDYGGETMRRMLKVESPFMRGNDVKEFQAAANIINNAGLTEDGIYGSASGSAAKALQSKFGLTADGIVGPKTWAAIDEALKPSTGSEFEKLYNQAQATLEKAQAEISSLTAQVNTLRTKISNAKAALG